MVQFILICLIQIKSIPLNRFTIWSNFNLSRKNGAWYDDGPQAASDSFGPVRTLVTPKQSWECYFNFCLLKPTLFEEMDFIEITTLPLDRLLPGPEKKKKFETNFVTILYLVKDRFLGRLTWFKKLRVPIFKSQNLRTSTSVLLPLLTRPLEVRITAALINKKWVNSMHSVWWKCK